MKRILKALPILVLILSLNIIVSAKLKSYDFDEDTNQVFSIGEVTYEVPSVWRASENNSEDYQDFYFDTGIFMVRRNECNGDILADENRVAAVNAVKNNENYKNMEDFMSFTLPLNKCNKEVLFYECSCTIGDQDLYLYSGMGSFENNTQMIAFTLCDYVESTYDHSNDFYSILDSVAFVEEEETEELQENNSAKSETEGETEKQTEHIETLGEQNALMRAADYLNYRAFSYTGLIEQLEFEGYTTSEATYAADNCGADWYEQAALRAQEYLDYRAFSKEGLKEQLEFEGFTAAQANYGTKAVGF